MKKKRLVALLLSTTIIMSSFGIVPETKASGEQTSLSIENDDLRIQFEENGTFAVTDIATNTIFASSLSTEGDNFSEPAYTRTVSSELVVHYYRVYEESTSALTDIAYSSSASAKVVKEDNNSIRVTYDFNECAFLVDVVYALKDTYLSASIDFSSFDEYGEFAVSKIELLPGFSAGTTEDTGYMLVPDGSGALIYFNNGETMQYREDVYGEETSIEKVLETSQTEKIHMPVFGTVRNDTAIFGIIDSGDAIANISAFSSSSVNRYNAAFSGANITFTSSKDMFANNSRNASTAYHKTDQTAGIDSYTVLYRFLTGDDADYSGMARTYREYLIKEQGLVKNVSEPVLNVDVIGAIDVKKNFLGLTYYKPLALTTYEQTVKLAQKLKESGVEKLSLRYIGWNNDGISNEKPLKKLKVMRVLGGSSKFEQMNALLGDMDINITYDVNLTNFYKGSKGYKVLSPFNEVLESVRYLRSVYSADLNTRLWYQLTPSRWNEISEQVIASAVKNDISRMSLTSLTSNIYSDFRSENPFTRGETKNEVVAIIQNQEAGIALSGDTVNAYAFSYVDKIYASPSYTSGYFVLDKEVPFYQMVLHGYVDLTTPAQFTAENQSINYLKAVETGAQLLYTGMYSSTNMVTDTDYDYLYGTEYTLWSEDAASKYASYQPLLEKIYDSEIVLHEELKENVFQTTYANGVSVIVNYNDTAVHVDGMDVAGWGFCEVMKR